MLCDDGLECPLDCPGLAGYVDGSWRCRTVGGPLTDNYDRGACGGPNRPFVDARCPRLSRCEKCGRPNGLLGPRPSDGGD